MGQLIGHRDAPPRRFSGGAPRFTQPGSRRASGYSLARLVAGGHAQGTPSAAFADQVAPVPGGDRSRGGPGGSQNGGRAQTAPAHPGRLLRPGPVPPAGQEVGPGVPERGGERVPAIPSARDRKSTRLNSSHLVISYAVFCLKKKKKDR